MSTRRVLVLDDDASARKLVEVVLSKNGYKVVAVGDVPSALGHLQEAPFDLLVSDYNLPEMDGLALIAKARQLQPALRAVLMSGDVRDEMRQAATSGGAAGFLAKPFHLPQLVELCRQALEKPLPTPPVAV